MEHSRALVEVLQDLRRAGVNAVVLDLHGTSRIDSAGLGAVVAVLKWCRAGGGELVVCGARGHVATTFKRLRLHWCMDIQEAAWQEDAA